MLWPCAPVRALWRLPELGVSQLLVYLGVLIMRSEGGVVGGVANVRKVLARDHFNPVGKLHTPPTSLAENPILVSRTEDYRVIYLLSRGQEYLPHHFILHVREQVGWKAWSVCLFIDLYVGDSGVIGGLNSHYSSKETNVKCIYSFEVRCG